MPLQYEPEELIIKHLRNELTEEENVALEEWKQKSPKNMEVFETLTNEASLTAELKIFKGIDKRAGYNKLLKKFQKPQAAIVRRMPALSRVAAAAVIILMLSVGGYFYFNKDQKPIATTDTKDIKNDVAPPEVNKAVLTLADGSTIVLDSAGNGSLAQQGNVNVEKTADGQIVYNGDATEIKYNTLTVPKGSKPMQIQLADGSKVWLNVASSITYPTAFVGKERKVKITGEGYFEVAHNAAMPFVVEKNEVIVEVLGTHFNVNTYDDETSLKVTLLEGSVNVKMGNKFKLLSPGQQAQISNGQISLDKNVDIDQVMAWKDGKFNFGEKSDIGIIMRQIARWYDVDVEYKGTVNLHFGGSLSRQVNISKVLGKLEETGSVKFKIDGRKIVVMP